MQVAQRRLAVTYPVRFLAGPDFCLAIICVLLSYYQLYIFATYGAWFV
jgi:hypothetical protein